MSTSREYNYDSLAQNLLDFAKKLVIKNDTRANECEDAASLKNANEYLMAYECIDTFSNHSDWTEYEFKRVGIPLEIIYDIIYGDEPIPEKYHDKLLQVRRERIIAEYVEYNNYYRMLNGLPNYGEEGVMTSFNKPTTELTDDELFQLQQGELDQLIIKNPQAEYLRYLSVDDRIDFFTARKAKNYEILNYRKHIIEEVQAAKFQEFYYQCRQYVLITNYSRAFSSMYYYDAFIILLIVFMALQRYINELYNFAIRKDFYSMEDIKNAFLSFGLPFFPDIPIKYQRNIVKNLNKLLKYKGTDKCLVDVIKLFGFNNVELYKYYLIKDFRRDKYGQPDIDVRSKEITYTLKFAQVPFDTTDITEALQDTTLYQEYEELVSDDPFWGDMYEDDSVQKFKEELLNLEFNYLNTKYLAVNTIFDVTKNTMDSAYFFNMINTLKTNGNLSSITFINKDIKPSGASLRLFDAITSVYYLLCKKFGYEDNILKSSTAIASVYDFKFNRTTEEILNRIEEKAFVSVNDKNIHMNKNRIQDDDIQTMPLNKSSMKIHDLVDLYFNNINYRDILINRMNNTNDYLEYKTLMEIFNFNMISDLLTNAYGNYTKYSDYLKNSDSELFTYIEDNSKNSKSLNLTISNILYAIEAHLNDYRFDDVFSNLSNLTGDIIKNYILKMVNVFKAYTVELKKFNIYYIFDEKFMNRINLLTYMYVNHKMSVSDSSLDDLIEDLYVYMDILHSDKLIENDGEKFLIEFFCELVEEIEFTLKHKFGISFVLSDGFNMDSGPITANSDDNTIIMTKVLSLGDKLFDDYNNKLRLFLDKIESE